MDHRWSHSPQRLRLLFLATMLGLSATLAGLGWHFLKQDELLSAQQAVMRRETAADLVATTLARQLDAIEHSLSRLNADGLVDASPRPGALLVDWHGDIIRTTPSDTLAYYPELPQTVESSEALAAASTAVAHVRAGRVSEALAAYQRLSDLGAAPIAGLPAQITGRLGALAVFESRKDKAELALAARALEDDVRSRRWRLTSAAYRYVTEQSGRWIVRPTRDHGEAFSDALEHLWEQRQAGMLGPSGRASLQSRAGPILMVWRSSSAAIAVHLEDRRFFDSATLSPAGVEVTLTNQDGTVAFGRPADPGDRSATRLASQTGLPWNLQVFGRTDAAEQATTASRRGYFAAGLAILLTAVVAGAWFISQSVTKQFAIARLQSDFVSAVSHEFRTPLTTLCQLSELLKRGRIGDERDRQTYYDLLHAESNRLRRLVERLLAFGRLEAGRTTFQYEDVDVVQLIRDTAETFERSQMMDGHRFDITVGEAGVRAHGDREALGAVLWNLLENAVKYSPDAPRVGVRCATEGGHVRIEVRDEGIGIPKDEQRQVFDPFVRGAAAEQRQIRGTGVGLALARQIVNAHGGEIRVESEPGMGSTFVVTLPATRPA